MKTIAIDKELAKKWGHCWVREELRKCSEEIMANLRREFPDADHEQKKEAEALMCRELFTASEILCGRVDRVLDVAEGENRVVK